MFKNLLVPVDGSKTSNLGLKEAIKLAKDQKATLTVLHVVDESPVLQSASFEGGGLYLNDLMKDLALNGKAILNVAVKTVEKAGLKARPILIEGFNGPVSDVIVKQAKKVRADLIVLGTHGRRGVSRLVMGSDAEGVVRQARVPVVLVRSHAPVKKRKK